MLNPYLRHTHLRNRLGPYFSLLRRKVSKLRVFDAHSSFPDGPDSKYSMYMGSVETCLTTMSCTSLTRIKFKEYTLDDMIGSFLSYNNVSTKIKETEHSLLRQFLTGCLLT